METKSTANQLELHDYAFSKKGIRQNRIVYLLNKNKSMSTSELCAELQCSQATIRNDLRELDQLRLIKRVFGGAAVTDDSYGCVPMEQHLEHSYDEKTAIARYVVQHIIKPEQSIVLDMGSTCLALARELANINYNISIITNSLLNASAIAQNPHVYLTLPGGTYSIPSDTFDNAWTLNYYNSIHPDYYIASANGISESGVTLTMTTDSTRAIIKQKIASNTDHLILLCDHTKVGKTCFYQMCSLSQIELIVTDSNCDEETREKFLKLGPPVVFADCCDSSFRQNK